MPGEHFALGSKSPYSLLASKRHQVKADLGILYLHKTQKNCGFSSVLKKHDTPYSFRRRAVSVVGAHCSSLTTAHEIGHNLGCNHDRDSISSKADSLPYAYGFRSSKHKFRTIMAYNCATNSNNNNRVDCPRINYYSNPHKSHKGVVMGVTDREDNTRAIRERAAVVRDIYTSANTPTIHLEDITVNEGEGQAVVRYTLSSAPKTKVVFTWSTRDGSAVSVSRGDYTAQYHQLFNLSQGTTQGTFTIPINDDSLDEEDESFAVIISSSSLTGIAASGSRLQATVTIEDNDKAKRLPTISISDVRIKEGDGQAVVRYALSSPSGAGATFTWSTREGSAVSGSRGDYTAQSHQLFNLSQGTTQGTFTIPINDDSLDEKNESFAVVISSSSLTGIAASGSRLQATVTIVDNDKAKRLPTISITDVTVSEGDGQAVVRYALSSPSGTGAKFHWSTRNGSAVSGSRGDYTARSNRRVDLSRGTTRGALTIPINDDSLDEKYESFAVVISPSSLTGIVASGSRLLQATVTIVDNDKAKRLPTISITDVTVSEGDGQAVVRYALSSPSGTGAKFHWSTRNGSAVSGSRGDYTARSNRRVDLSRGTTRGALTIPINDDSLDEKYESFAVVISLSSLTGIVASGSRLQATVTIVDNDKAKRLPTISISDVRIKEGDGQAVVRYALSSPSGEGATFTWSTRGGSAVSGSRGDYTARSNRRVDLSRGTTRGALTIPINDDSLDEKNESFAVVISPSSLTGIAASGSRLQATVTIVDSASNIIIDVMIGYSYLIESSEGGRNAALAFFNKNISITNTAHKNSRTRVQFRIKEYVRLDNFKETNTRNARMYFAIFNIKLRKGESYFSSTTTPDESSYRLLASKRRQVKADLGILYLHKTQKICGVAAVLTKDATSDSYHSRAVNVVGAHCPGLVTAHEIGHNLGCHHDRDNTSSTYVLPYAYGFRSSKHKFRTIMAYNCTSNSDNKVNCPRINYYSNPHKSHKGVVMGATDREDNARNIRQRASVVRDIYTSTSANSPIIHNEGGGSMLQAMVTIEDNDRSETILPTISITDVTVSEGDGQAVVRYALSSPSRAGATFFWSTRDGSAVSSSRGDYSARSHQLFNLSPGTTRGTFTIPINDDSLLEGDESFAVIISPSSLTDIVASGSRLQATVTIVDNDKAKTLPTISISDVRIKEGDGQAVVRYALSSPSGTGAKFHWSTREGSAVSGSRGDYTARSNRRVDLSRGTTRGTLTIPINDDSLDEKNESFAVVISPSSLTGIVASGSRLQATVAIVDNDKAKRLPTISISDVRIKEGDGQAVVRYALSSPSGTGAKFHWSTREGSAVSGSRGDYTARSNRRVDLSRGTTRGTLTIPINDDSLDEKNESFAVVISPSSLTGIVASGSRLQATVAIVDNDKAKRLPTISISDVRIKEGDGQAVVRYALSSPSGAGATFTWSTREGSAVSGSRGDYTAQSHQLFNLSQGTTRGALTIPINDDSLDEKNESFAVVISSSSLTGIVASGSRLQATVTIVDNDKAKRLPTISISDVRIKEGDGQAVVRYALSSPSGTGAKFHWSTREGSAVSGSRGDYTARSNRRVDLSRGTTRGTLTIPINDDSLDEKNESFAVVISPSSLTGIVASGSRLQATVAIVDNDKAKRLPTISISDVRIKEGDGQAVVRYALSSPSGTGAKFHWSTREGSAVSGSRGDYTARSNRRVNLSRGTTRGTLTIPINDDSLDEKNESFAVVISPSSLTGIVASGSRLQATVAIVDNDKAKRLPTISITDVTVSEGDGQAVVRYALSSPSGAGATFTWSTREGSAVSGSRGDYTAQSHQLFNLSQGTTQGTFTIPINDDSLDEKNENFAVVISSSSLTGIAASGSRLQATVTIVDNDKAKRLPTISISDVRIKEGDGQAVVRYALSSPSGTGAKFHWSTREGSAVSGSRGDYTARSNRRVDLSRGTTRGTLTIPINDDSLDEKYESFAVVISPSSLTGIVASGSRLQATVAIVDNDKAKRLPTISITDVTVSEGDGQAVVRYALSSPSGAGATFTWSTREGSAVSGSRGDYTARSNRRVDLSRGTTRGALTIPINDDSLDEKNESFAVIISSSSLTGIAASGSRLQATVTIVDSASNIIIDVMIGYSYLIESSEGGRNAALAFFNKNISITNTAHKNSRTRVQFRIKEYVRLDNFKETNTRNARKHFALGSKSPYRLLASKRRQVKADLGILYLHKTQKFCGVASALGKHDTPDSFRRRAVSVIGAHCPGLVTAHEIGHNLGCHHDRDNTSSTYGLPYAYGFRSSKHKFRTIMAYNCTSNSDNEVDCPRINYYSNPHKSHKGVVMGATDREDNARNIRQRASVVRDIYTSTSANSPIIHNEGGGSMLQAMVTIEDNDRSETILPTISITDVTVSEGDGQAVVRYALSSPSRAGATFFWSTRDGSAVSSSRGDYSARSHQLFNLSPGTTRGTFTIPINDDSLLEGDESFAVIISPSSLTDIVASGSRLQATVTIVDNDKAKTLPTISLSDVRINEGNGQAIVYYTLGPDRSKDAGFSWSTRNGSAVSGSGGDYIARSSHQRVYLADASQGRLIVPINDDSLLEGDESFKVVISSSSLTGIEILGSRLQATVTIEDNDRHARTPAAAAAPAPTISISDVTVNEGDGRAVVRYALSSASESGTRFYWSTRDHSALHGNDGDYTAKFGWLTLPLGTSQGTLKIPINDDSLKEVNEHFNIYISTSSLRGITARGSRMWAKVTIEDNDKTAIKTHTDSFTKTRNTYPLSYDILWVVQNSARANAEVQKLANSFSTFISSFVASHKDSNFKMAIITTGSASNLVRSSFPLNQNSLANDEDAFIEEFKKRIMVADEGDSLYKGVNFSQIFLSSNASWMKRNSYSIIIYISSRSDQSKSESVSDWVSRIQSYKSVPSQFRIYSIVNTRKSSVEYGGRYIKASHMTGGKVGDIGGDFRTILQSFEQHISALPNFFLLSKRKVISIKKVLVDGVPNDDWSYDGHSTITFNEGAVPSGLKIEVTYQYVNR